MMIIMTAALAAAVPAVEPTSERERSRTAHCDGRDRSARQTKCCDCCKGMAKKHEGHSEHPGHAAE